MSKLLFNIISPCLLLLVICLSVSAQSSTATLSGTVEDEKGAIIPSANVTIVNTGTGARRNATTNESGSFTFPLLPPGTYSVTIAQSGFATVQIPDLVLNVGDQKAIQVGLKVGDVSAAIEVRPDETLINTSPAVTNTIDRTFVQNLPLNGRSFQTLILLTPGVTVVPTSGSNAGQFSVNGNRSNANYFTVDGVSANTGANSFSFNSGGISQLLGGAVPGLTTTGGTQNLVSADALEEFKMQTSTYSAEFGRQPGAQVSLVTRSGKNEFQGSLFEYLRNEKFDSNDWFANASGNEKAPLRQNQFGGTFSGPVFLPRFGDDGSTWYNGRNRTFFFFAYEGLRLVLPQAKTVLVPSVRLRELTAPPAVRTLLNAFPLPTGPETLSTCTQPLPPALPDPLCSGSQTGNRNGLRPSGLAPFIGVYSDPSSANIAGIRIDHNVDDKLTIFGRYNSALSSSTIRGVSNNLSGFQENKIDSRTLTLASTLIITSKLTNELRFNYSSDEGDNTRYLDDFGGAVPIDLSSTISRLGAGGSRVISQAFFTPVPGSTIQLGQGPSYRIEQRQMNLIENLSWFTRGHQIKLGIDYRRLAPVFSGFDYTQNIIFSNEGQIRTGTVGNFSIVLQEPAKPIFTNISIYGQDRWKVSPRLTVDLGLRWEINPAPTGDDVKKLVVLVGVEDLPTASLAPPGTPLYKTTFEAFAPRAGIAYQLSDKKGWETVTRGGFGVYYDLGSGQSSTGFFLYPFAVSNSVSNVPFPIPPQNVVPPSTPVVRLPITSNINLQDPELKLPYTLQWNLALEQSLGQNQTVSASYVASAGRRLLTTPFLNRAVAGVRPNPNFGNIFYTTNGPASDYHSLQVQYRRRLTRGLQTLANYTWSHAIDEVSDEVSNGVFDRGNAAFDVRHNFSSAVTYDLPGRRLPGIAGQLLGDWNVGLIIHAQSGFPVELSAGFFTREDGTLFFVRPDLVTGQPLYLNDATVAGGRRFNSAAFKLPPLNSSNQPTRQGTLGRNVMRGLPLYQVDLSLKRQFKLSEKLLLQLSADTFNLFNHPNFGGYGTSITIPSNLGVPTQMLGRSLGGLNALYQIGGPRSLQFSIRLGF